MKKIFAVFSVILVFVVFFTSCAESSFVDLASFIGNYNKISDDNILDFPDFTVTTGSNSETIYTKSFSANKETVMLRLVSDDDKRISSLRVIYPKCDAEGKELAESENRLKLFSSVCKNSLCAFSLCSKEDADRLTKLFALTDAKTMKKTGEQTHNEGSFYCIFLSNEFCCEFIVKNTWLCEIEETLKPESKGGFVEGTGIRTETVALQ